MAVTPRDDIAGLLNDIEDRLKERDALQARVKELEENITEIPQLLRKANARAAALEARVKELEANPTPQDYLKMSRMWADEKARATRLQQERDSLKVDCSAYASRNTNLRNDLVLAGMARDAAQQERDEAYERAAKEADQLEDHWSREWRDGLKADTHLEGMSDGASAIAAAIRRLAGPEKEKTE